MIIDDLWDCHGPSRADLKVLERIGRHRRAFEDLTPAGEHLTSIRERLLALLDVMEETLCEEGRSSPSLAEAWQRIDELEESYREDEAAAPSHSASRPKAAVVLDTNPSPDAETPLAANDSARSPKAA